MVDAIDDVQFLEQYQRAVEVARQSSATEPQAVSVHYDDINRLVVIRLNSGASFSFPPDIGSRLGWCIARRPSSRRDYTF
jgi:hypothetical protein